jgi:uncharacterized double-CXXCG motif protein
MKFYQLEPVAEPRFTGQYRADHRWNLPGIRCPLCGTVWSDISPAFPCTDLSGLDARDQEEFSPRLEEDYANFVRLCALVRPLVPPGVPLWPGTDFGPLVGSATGSFGQLFMQYSWTLLIRREALEQLQAEGVRNLQGRRAELRFRQKSAPELVELQLEPHGRMHRDCLPADLQPPCAKCDFQSLTLPEQPILDAASLPAHLDLFRLSDMGTVIVGTERLVDTVRRLGFEEVALRELPVR